MNKNNDKINVALLRVSSSMQDTISQEQAIKDYCINNKIVIDKYIEEYAVSGFKTPMQERKGLNEIKDLAINGKLDNLVVFNMDRIGRRIELISFISLLTECGVIIHSVTEGIINENSEYSDLINSVKLFMANAESKKIGNRVKAGKKASANQGRWQSNQVPFGYIKNEDGTLQIDKSKSPIVKEIFDMYIKTNTKTTLEWLDTLGVHFSRVTLLNIIRNEVYIGIAGKKLKLPYDNDLQIIDNEIFYRANELVKNRTYCKDNTIKTANRTIQPLEGLLYHKCSDDKISKLTVSYTYSAGKKYYVYRCEYCKMKRLKNKKTFPANKITKTIEAEVIKELNTLSIDTLESEYCKKKALKLALNKSEIDNLTNVLNTKNKALTGANDTLEKVFSGELDIDITIISNKIKQISNDIVELEKKINDLNTELHQKEIEELNKSRLLDKYKNIENIYHLASDTDKRTILNEIIDKVYIDTNDNITIHMNI